jgi:hypothetical protein
MTYLINDTSNLYKTKVTVRTHTPEVTKFLSTTNEARIAIISNSSNVEPVMYFDWRTNSNVTSNITYISKADNIFYLGTSLTQTSNKEIYIAVDKKQAIHKIATFRPDGINLNADTVVYASLLPSSNIYNIGSQNKKWRNLILSGCNLNFNEAILEYNPTDNELNFKHNKIIRTPVPYDEIVHSNIPVTSNINGSNVITSNYTISSNVTRSSNLINSNIEFVPLTAKHLSVYSEDGSRAILATSEYGTTLVSYSSEADLISSLELTSLNTNQIAEGSNLYFTFERARAVIEANATQSASSVIGTSNQLIQQGRALAASFQSSIDANTSNLIISVNKLGTDINSNLLRDYNASILNIRNTSNQLNQTINSTLTTFNPTLLQIDSNTSNYLRAACNQILDTLKNTSNSLLSQLSTISTNASNQISTTSNDITVAISFTSNTLTSIINSSNNDITYSITLSSNSLDNFWLSTSNEMATRITTNTVSLTSYITITSNALKQQITDTSNYIASDVTSNYASISQTLNTASNQLATSINSLSTNINNRISGLTLDDIKNGTTNKYITSNIYDGDLTVSNLTTRGHVLPAINEAYSLGSCNQRWRDLYLSGNIHLADARISATASQGIEIKNSTGDLLDIVVSKVLIKDSVSGGYTVLQSVNNAISIGAATSDSTTVTSNVEKVTYTSSISEGSNLFFTATRAGAIAAASNVFVNAYTTTTSNSVSARITALTTDQIANGTSNKFIVNNTYTGDLSVYATLTVSNLNIIGSTANIQTNEYKTEMLRIDTQATDGPALKVINNSLYSNIAEFYYDTTPVLIINSTGNVAVGKTTADEKLDVQGNIKFGGRINNVTAAELSYLSGLTSPVQPQLNAINTDNSNLTSNLIVTFTKLYTDNSNQLSTTINNNMTNMQQYINNASNSFSISVNNTSNSIMTYVLSLGVGQDSNLLNMSNVLNTSLQSTLDNINTQIDSLQPNLNAYVTNTCNALLQNVTDTSNVIRGRLNTIVSTGWQATGSNIIFLNKVSIGSNLFGSETLTVVGNIKFSGSINEVTSNEFSYLNGVTSPIGAQVTAASSNLFNYTINFSVGLFSTTSNSITTQSTNLNSNIYFGYVTSTSNDFMTNVRTTSNILSTNINAFLAQGFVPSQWSNINSDIYYTIGNVGIGTTSVTTNELEVYGDIVIYGDYNLKKTLDDGVTVENYQIERWLDSPTYDNTDGVKYIYYNDGYVGVKKGTPGTNLHVGRVNEDNSASIFNTGTLVTCNFINPNTTLSSNNTGISDVCAIFDSALWCKSTIASASDQRIKTNIDDINDDNALQKIMSIQPKTYNYIDPMKGGDKVYGFLAQQIKEVIPEAVGLRKEVVPNIFTVADCSYNVITFVYDPAIVLLGTKLSIITLEGVWDMYTVIALNDGNSITIDKNIDTNKVFVYGTEVNDFHTLDKTYIYTLNVCATQILSRDIDAITERVQTLEQQLGITSTTYLTDEQFHNTN